ncbi:MAG: alpha-L-fucosidase [Phycisphaerales bacterium]|nr:alpha-L-fucosidase [Phycisphaerales bacterium]
MKHALLLVPTTLILLAAAAGWGCAQRGTDATAPATGSTTITADSDRMTWWREARFGMFIHWGVYSVPAGMWNGKTTGGASEWLMESLHVPTSAYVNFADGFTAASYEPEVWARLAKRAGMKYVVITSRHHDGFCLWDSAASEWDVMASPAKRDLLAPLATAVRAEGLKFGLYYSILDWRHPDYEPRRAWNDRPEWNGGPGYRPDFAGRFVPYVHAQVAEIIKAYDPAVLWFDGEWENSWTTPLGRALYDDVRKQSPGIIVNNRVGKSRDDMAGLTKPGEQPLGDFCTPEQEVPATGLPGVDWETCMTMNDSWGYKASDKNFKSADQIVRTLCDIASKGGNFLLNIGPRPDGTIPQESVERLTEVGRWMAVNGDSIDGTTASPFKTLSWGRATQKGSTLNLIVFDWPADGKLELAGLKTAVRSARVVSLDKMKRTPTPELTEQGVTISSLGPRPSGLGATPVVVRVELEGEPRVITPPPPAIGRDALGGFTLSAGAAETEGARIKLQGKGATENLGFWTSSSDKAVWTIANPTAGEYRAEVELSCIKSDAGCAFEVALGKSVARGTVPSTGSWNAYTTVTVSGLRVTADAPTLRLEVRAAPGTTLKGGLMNLRQVRLIRSN